MAQLILGATGAAVGGSLLPGGLGILGASVSGSALGGLVGATVGARVDGALASLFAPTRQGPRLSHLQVLSAREGAPIPSVYGRARVSGQVIWAARFKETSDTRRVGSGKSSTKVEDYSYSLSFAVAICEGEIDSVARIWADGRVLDTEGLAVKVYKGTDDQMPDATIEAIEGSGQVPSYKGVAYVVFEDFPLGPFGNRLPQLAFEVVRKPTPLVPERDLNTQLKAINLIPGAGEFVYATEGVSRQLGPGRVQGENLYAGQGPSDFEVALDQLQAAFPNLETVFLVVSWFGTDLRLGACEIKPGVEQADKTTTPLSWQVNSVSRAGVHEVSQVGGSPAFGGTPSDQTVLQAIAALKARGYKVGLYPFLMMDIPPGNGLPDPYGGAEQAAYPWRGRITCHPAPGEAGSPDKTSALQSEVESFFGAAEAAHFMAGAGTTTYSGPAEWSFRRCVLHHAQLAAMAGGVDVFIIGSELRGLTTLRSGADVYPAVSALQDLAAEVRALLGSGPEVTYAADWSEYFGHQPQDGSGDVYYHLDPLWADSAISSVGIDWYPPLSDWRDGHDHLDTDLADDVADHGYLADRMRAGEGYEWYYASEADRHGQLRTAITDGAHGKPWVFRPKDLTAWWQNAHYNRPGGVESASPTAWQPGGKPVRIVEFGVPAIDKGPNAPNLFVDAKSAESAVPPFSTGVRDAVAQRVGLEAMLTAFADDQLNPEATVYAGRMLTADGPAAWAWDARPYPAFPAYGGVWADAPAWSVGHWLNGRAEAAPLADVIVDLLGRCGVSDFDISGVRGLVTGLVRDRTLSARDMLEHLCAAHNVVMSEQAGTLVFRHPAPQPLMTVDDDMLVLPAGGPRLQVRREPAVTPKLRVQTADVLNDFQPLVVEVGAGDEIVEVALPVVADRIETEQMAQKIMARMTWGAERVQLRLPLRHLALEVGDTVRLALPPKAEGLYLVERLMVGRTLGVQMRPVGAVPVQAGSALPVFSVRQATGTPSPVVSVLDLPVLDGLPTEGQPKVAGFVSPFSEMTVSAAPAGLAKTPRAVLRQNAIVGETEWDFYPGPIGRWDRGNRVRVKLYGGQLSSESALAVFNGANRLAIEDADERWEVVQFQTAELVAPLTYDLSHFLRGLGGSENLTGAPVPAGARVVVLDRAEQAAEVSAAELDMELEWQATPQAGQAKQILSRWQQVAAEPLAPVHVQARWQGADMHLSWVRRARLRADSWAGDVPLDETTEAYEVTIYEGETAKRTLLASGPSVTYTAAEMASDFPSGLPYPLVVGVAQRGASGQPGRERRVQVWLS